MSDVKLSNPAAVGLAGFALTTFLLSCQNTGLLQHSSGLWAMVPLAIFYGGLAQFIAGIMEFKTGNTFGMTAFISYGSFWMALSFLMIFLKIGIVPSDAFSGAMGITLVAWTLFTAYMMLLTYVSKDNTLIAIFTFLEITFILLDIGNYAGSDIVTAIGGWVGIFVAILAWYGSWKAIRAQFVKK
jgi:succinate-acetate transporter protein